MKRFLLLCMAIALTLTSVSVYAQDRTVSGRVTSTEDGSPLPGVNVVLKGTTTGTATDADGKFSLSVPGSGGALVFSFIGLESKEVEIGDRAVVDVSLSLDVTQLSEVVVTALGTKQNAREVTYANQTVKSEDLLSSPSKNALEALRGKTAGVNITTGSGSVGASTRIVLRGEASLTGNNNALIVVDGVPIDNSSNTGGSQGSEAGYSDFGNRFNDIDPNNIASVTILKGPSATSLYGSRGASGVLLITTKSGAKGKMKVNLNSTGSVEQAYILQKRQDKWGQGILNPDGSTSWDSGENFSWGARFDGVVRPWTSPVDTDGDGDTEWLSRPWSPVKNQIEDFFRLGYTFNNALSLSGGDDRFTYFTSYSNTNQNGIMENTNYKRNNFVVNSTAKLNDKLSAGVNLSYSAVVQNTAQEGARPFEGQNPYASALQAPTSIPYTDLRDYKNPYHSFEGFYGSYTINPYFIMNEFRNEAKTNNMLSAFQLTYNPVSSVTLFTRLGINYVAMDRLTTIPKYEYLPHYYWGDNLSLNGPRNRSAVSAGSHSERMDNSRNIDWTTTAAYTKDLSDKLKLTATLGTNIFDVQRRSIAGQTNGGFVVPGVYNLGNSKERPSSQQIHQAKRIIGIFGDASFAYDDKIFLKGTYRVDYSSTLPVDNQSFDYFSISGSAILSDYLGLDSSTPVSYVKVRAGYGTSGKDADMYQLQSLYTVNPTFVDFDGQDESTWQLNSPLNGQTAITKNGLIGNNTLTPEKTGTFEAGTDVTFLDGRVELSYTYYDAKSTQQIFVAELPRSSGFVQTPVNIGEMVNKGHELTLTVVPVKLQNGFKWTSNITWSKNTNEVLKVSNESDDFVIFDTGRGVTLRAEKGQPFGNWKGTAQKFSPDGRLVVNEQGNRAYDSEISTIGNVQADWRANMLNTFTWKGISFGFLLDWKHGGDIFSTTKFYTEFNGTAETTAINDRQNFVIPNSVQEVVDADGNVTGYVDNTTPVDAYSYFNDQNASEFVIDGSFVKLREVTLGYSLPKSLVSKIKLSDVRVNLFAKNLKFWLPSENKFGDPEVIGPSGTATNAIGVESSQTPPQRSFGINLNITL